MTALLESINNSMFIVIVNDVRAACYNQCIIITQLLKVVNILYHDFVLQLDLISQSLSTPELPSSE